MSNYKTRKAMKAKLFFASLILAMAFLLSACNSIMGPDNYKVEIEDSYRMQVVVTFAYLTEDESTLDDFIIELKEKSDKIEEENSALNKPDVAKFRIALEKLSTNNNLAKELLDDYKKIDVKFSEFKKAPKEGDFYVWTATEENYGVRVTFKNSVEEWELDVNEDDLEAYIEKSLQSLADSIDNTPSSNIIPEELESDDSKISIFIENVYSGKVENKKAMSNDFYNLSNAAIDWNNAKSVNDFADRGYWKYADGRIHKFTIGDIEEDENNEDAYNVTIAISTSSGERMVQLTILSANQSYCISDICMMTEMEDENTLEYCYSDVFEMEISERQEVNHKGNY